MEHRVQACSHYCEHKKEKTYIPNGREAEEKIKNVQKYKNSIKSNLLKTKFGSYILNIIRNLKGFWDCPALFNKRYCSNNNLGIFLTTSCNLSCINCQVSARQAPANDNMSVEQVQRFVNEAMALRYYWNKIFITGGEPTLHPQFFEMLDVLKQYKDFNPECMFVLETNGAGTKVRSVLAKLPDWVTVCNTNKKEEEKNYNFFVFFVAAVDSIFCRFLDFSKGCETITSCYGLCASMYGYYPCSPCLTVDRVFGFDIGTKKLSAVTENSLRKQMSILCKNCGWFMCPLKGGRTSTEKMSRSWKKAFAQYEKQKPKLSIF